MIKTIAKALLEDDKRARREIGVLTGQKLPDPGLTWKDFERSVVVALVAMRNPDQSVFDAADDGLEDLTASQIWERVIDEILADGDA